MMEPSGASIARWTVSADYGTKFGGIFRRRVGTREGLRPSSTSVAIFGIAFKYWKYQAPAMDENNPNLNAALEQVDEGKRATLRRLIGTGAFMGPIIVSFAMGDLSIDAFMHAASANSTKPPTTRTTAGPTTTTTAGPTTTTTAGPSTTTTRGPTTTTTAGPRTTTTRGPATTPRPRTSTTARPTTTRAPHHPSVS